MKKNITCAIIKPNVIKDNKIGKIIEMIESKKFIIKNIKMIKMTKKNAEDFYYIHKNRPFYNELCDYMSSHEVIILILLKENAVIDFRNLIGDTDPKKSKINTIRKIFGKSIDENAIHGSDSNQNAEIEYNFLKKL